MSTEDRLQDPESRAERFLANFAEDFCSQFIDSENWNVDSVSLGRLDNGPVTLFVTLTNRTTGETLELRDELIYFDPAEKDDDKIIGQMMRVQKFMPREEVVKRLTHSSLVAPSKLLAIQKQARQTNLEVQHEFDHEATYIVDKSLEGMFDDEEGYELVKLSPKIDSERRKKLAKMIKQVLVEEGVDG